MEQPIVNEATQEQLIRVGSRKSELALIQTKHVIGRLQDLFPEKRFEIHTMSTIGDRVLNVSLPKIGEKSLFTRDLEDALRNGGVDFVVHSLKDLPTALPTGMAIGAILEREDARDALVLNSAYAGHTIGTLPKGSIIGTSSLRRTAQIRRKYPQLQVCDIRGNLNTRLAKLDAPGSKFAGIILAQAGLVRMGWTHRISQVLEPNDLLYAVGQGALAVECRANDAHVLHMLQQLMCLSTSCRILAERSFLKTLGGGCSAPVAVWSNLEGDIDPVDQTNANSPNLQLTGAVWSLDGATELRDELKCCMQLLGTERRSRSRTISYGDGQSNSSCEEPPQKRRALDNATTERDNSPPVINDDLLESANSSGYNMDELIAKHAELAKQCPFLSHNNDANANVAAQSIRASGGGDADVLSNTAAAHCPLKVEIGQDFMGQCPFVDDAAKVTLAAEGNCPLTTQSTDANDNAIPIPSSSSQCPYASMHDGAKIERKSVDKCPFLRKTVKMYDYADEDKPTAALQAPILIEDVENLFCGVFRHACYERGLFVKSHKLGKQLAEELIKKGALEIMKVAQAEIHGKV